MSFYQQGRTNVIYPMEAKEIRELNISEIDKKIRDTRDQMLHMRLHKETGQVENPSEIRSLRRDIARLETIVGEMRAAENKK